MPAARFNCYLCGEKIAANEESERVERGLGLSLGLTRFR
jgi:hypothetical protein